MKKFQYIVLVFFAHIILASSCQRDGVADNNKWIYADTANANIKLVHCIAANSPTLPVAATPTTGPQVFVYLNSEKMNGNALSYGGQWPSAAVYASTPVKGNNVRVDVVMARLSVLGIASPAPIAGDTLHTFYTNLASGKYYSFYLGDTLNNYKVNVVEDALPIPAYQKYKIRLANFTMNPNDSISVYSRRNASVIITNVPHKGIADWVELNVPDINDTLDLRFKGQPLTTAPFSSLPLSAVPSTTILQLAGLRMYTIVARGKTGLTNKGVSANIFINR